MQEAIIRTNTDPIPCRIYVALGGDDLKNMYNWFVVRKFLYSYMKYKVSSELFI